MDSEAMQRGENCEFTSAAGESVSAATSLVYTLSKRNRSAYDDTTDASNKKLRIDEILCVRYYDRQGVIRSNNVSIVTDLPRCPDLLLSFQRFTIGDQANSPCPSGLLCLDAKTYPEMVACKGACHLAHKTNGLLEDEFSMPPSVSSNTRSLKVPLIFRASMRSTSGKSYRIFKMTVLEDLVRLTSETGRSFVDAWLDVVTCTLIFNDF